MKEPHRTVGRSHSGAALVAALGGLAATLGALASPGDAGPRPEVAASPQGARIGMNSCAARGCHGSVDATDPSHGRVYIKDGAYTTWLNYDPHARAYAVLLDPRSERIAAQLQAPLGNKPAHQAALCLSCHATPSDPSDPAPTAREGISCEGCHGPAGGWVDQHLVPSWRARPAPEKARDGLVNLASPSSRAKACVACHVGDRSRGMDMNHDLIAAGHPRLNFEFASYLEAYPKHWEEKPGGEARGAKAWAIGQVVTARAVVDLLGARALASKEGAARKAPAPEAVWPEFSEYECFTCHHGLASPSPRQGPVHVPGRLAWATWPSAMLPELARSFPSEQAGGPPPVDFESVGSPWQQLRREMVRPSPDPDRVVELAGRAGTSLDALLKSLESGSVDPAGSASLLARLAGPRTEPGEGWDRLAQRYLALEALSRSGLAPGSAIGPEVGAAIVGAAKALEFPTGYDSPRGSAPASKPGPPSRPRP